MLKTVPVEQLQNKDLRIQGESASLNEVVELWERKHKVSFAHVLRKKHLANDTLILGQTKR